MRRGWLLSTILLSLVLSLERFQGAPSQDAAVLVLVSCRTPAYQAAVEALRDVVVRAGVPITIVPLDFDGSREVLLQELARKPAVGVAVGSAAVEALGPSGYDLPTVATMVLDPMEVPAAHNSILTAIALDVPPAATLTQLKKLYPRRNRIAVIRGPALTAASVARIQAGARIHGYQVQFIDCPGPKELLEAVAPLRGRFDFIWCLPDSALYRGAAVPALILASVRYGLPLIGFSEGIVKAGALVGFYPDYRDIGRQTGESVLQLLHGRPLPRCQYPRKVIGAVNERVVWVLGGQYAPRGRAEFVTLR